MSLGPAAHSTSFLIPLIIKQITLSIQTHQLTLPNQTQLLFSFVLALFFQSNERERVGFPPFHGWERAWACLFSAEQPRKPNELIERRTKSMNGCFRGDERQAHNPQTKVINWRSNSTNQFLLFVGLFALAPPIHQFNQFVFFCSSSLCGAMAAGSP